MPTLTSGNGALCQPTSYPSQSTNNGYWQWDTGSCQWVWVDCANANINCSASPIVIDTTGKGFEFTDPTKGQYVLFDIRGNGIPEKISWTKAGSGNAWLAYDRDGDGVIKDGSELFGNFTPHSDGGVADRPYTTLNGFLALAWYDRPAQGGNGDLILDKNDPIWPKLRLWIDEHCYLSPDAQCQSQPSELHTLESMGITSLSLVYQNSNKKDAIGNEYRFMAAINPEISQEPIDPHSRQHMNPKTHESCCMEHMKPHEGRWAYDVFLKEVPID